MATILMCCVRKRQKQHAVYSIEIDDISANVTVLAMYSQHVHQLVAPYLACEVDEWRWSHLIWISDRRPTVCTVHHSPVAIVARMVWSSSYARSHRNPWSHCQPAQLHKLSVRSINLKLYTYVYKAVTMAPTGLCIRIELYTECRSDWWSFESSIILQRASWL